jgi:DNA-binding response OmpR family regulator
VEKERPLRVLLVDDNANLAWSARQLLEMSGAAVDVSADLRSARKAIKASRYDVCLIDLMLPNTVILQ